jgi:hypothetical protein
METFTIGIGHRWWAQVFRRNRLVRHSDRIEVLVRGFALVLVVVAIPVAAAIGTSVHDGRTRVYAEESYSRHQVTATAVERGEVVVEYRGVSFMARATWSASGRDYTDVVNWTGLAKIGDRQAIWVNDAGAAVGPPSPPSRAVGEAVTIATLVWFGVAGVAAGVVFLVGRWLNRRRFAQWDDHIKAFRANQGRTNHQ